MKGNTFSQYFGCIETMCSVSIGINILQHVMTSTSWHDIPPKRISSHLVDQQKFDSRVSSLSHNQKQGEVLWRGLFLQAICTGTYLGKDNFQIHLRKTLMQKLHIPSEKTSSSCLDTVYSGWCSTEELVDLCVDCSESNLLFVSMETTMDTKTTLTVFNRANSQLQNIFQYSHCYQHAHAVEIEGTVITVSLMNNHNGKDRS